VPVDRIEDVILDDGKGATEVDDFYAAKPDRKKSPGYVFFLGGGGEIREASFF
jgi:hypothetical protein